VLHCSFATVSQTSILALDFFAKKKFRVSISGLALLQKNKKKGRMSTSGLAL